MKRKAQNRKTGSNHHNTDKPLKTFTNCHVVVASNVKIVEGVPKIDDTSVVEGNTNIGTRTKLPSDPFKMVNSVFSCGTSTAHRAVAVEILCERLKDCPVETLVQHSISWLNTLQKLLSGEDSTREERAVCCYTIGQLLVYCSQQPDLRRDISQHCIPGLLTALLSADRSSETFGSQQIATVHCIKLSIKLYPGSCLSFKNKLEAYLLDILLLRDNLPTELEQICTECYAFLPACGGGGNALGSKHSEMWSEELARLCHASLQMLNNLYNVAGEKPYEVPLDKLTPLPAPAADSADVQKMTSKYLSVYMKLIKKMLSTPFESAVRVPVKHVLKLICKATNVTPDSVIFRRDSMELQSLLTFLTDIHVHAIAILATLVELCGSNMHLHMETITRLLSAQFYWTSAVMKDVNKDGSTLVRAATYAATLTLLNSPGCAVDIQEITDLVAENCLLDLLPQEISIADSTLKVPPTKRSKQSVLKPSVVRSECANPITLQALGVLEKLLLHCSAYASARCIKNAYDKLVSVAEKMQSRPDVTPYCDPAFRMALYQCLQAALVSYNHHIAPPTDLLSSVFANGLVDRCPMVRCACIQAQMLCEVIMHPRAPPLEQMTCNTRAGRPAQNGILMPAEEIPKQSQHSVLEEPAECRKDPSDIHSVEEVSGFEDQELLGVKQGVLYYNQEVLNEDHEFHDNPSSHWLQEESENESSSVEIIGASNITTSENQQTSNLDTSTDTPANTDKPFGDIASLVERPPSSVIPSSDEPMVVCNSQEVCGEVEISGQVMDMLNTFVDATPDSHHAEST